MAGSRRTDAGTGLASVESVERLARGRGWVSTAGHGSWSEGWSQDGRFDAADAGCADDIPRYDSIADCRLTGLELPGTQRTTHPSIPSPSTPLIHNHHQPTPYNQQHSEEMAEQKQMSTGDLKEWKYPLMNSHMDIMNTIIACCVPCITHGQIHEKAGWGTCMSGGLVYLLAYCCGCCYCVDTWRRETLRREKGIRGNVADDILASYACEVCARVQELHEVQD
ncbi:alanine--glyoxylate aminotransferase 2 [Phlyctochytrium bullatum]|nr:alanine--glyoxylate aminotransferase 2 [Phlyctochytrium bullatum]